MVRLGRIVSVSSSANPSLPGMDDGLLYSERILAVLEGCSLTASSRPFNGLSKMCIPTLRSGGPSSFVLHVKSKAKFCAHIVC
jgi:hypothetical protein